MNKTPAHHPEHAVLLEGSHHTNRLAVYGRYEWVQKSLEDLNLDEGVYGHDAVFPVHAFTAGTSYDILLLGKTKFALGGQFSFYNPDKRLSGLYGDNPLVAQIYLRIYPLAMGRRAGSFYLPY